MKTPFSPSAKRKLLAWFDRNARPLPWRRDRDPYRIWVSEVMLQQTTVAAVAPRFEQLLAAFPNVRALAAADEQAVLKVWEGLGYYGRARNLRRAAQVLVEQHGGELPDDPAVWAELPGVGRYILGAVLSQAFDRRLPIVEANTKRVLCRLFAQAGDVSSAPVQAWLWETAAAILPRKRVGDFNQALMELGALVCTPDRPDCPKCPLRAECLAHREGGQDRIPRRPARPTPARASLTAPHAAPPARPSSVCARSAWSPGTRAGFCWPGDRPAAAGPTCGSFRVPSSNRATPMTRPPGG